MPPEMAKQVATLHLTTTFSRVALRGIPRSPSWSRSSKIQGNGLCQTLPRLGFVLPWPFVPEISGQPRHTLTVSLNDGRDLVPHKLPLAQGSNTSFSDRSTIFHFCLTPMMTSAAERSEATVWFIVILGGAQSLSNISPICVYEIAE